MDCSGYRKVLEDSAQNERHKPARYQQFERILASQVRGQCLEVGCGDGNWTAFLAEYSRQLVSLDLSLRRIGLAKKNSPGVTFVLSDARYLPFKDKSFDTICALEVIEHLPKASDQDRFLQELRRVLKDQGQLLISTPNKPLFRIYCKITKEEHSTHFCELSYRQFKSLLKDNFSSVKIYGQFGWLGRCYKFTPFKFIHGILSKWAFVCKALLAVCRV